MGTKNSKPKMRDACLLFLFSLGYLWPIIRGLWGICDEGLIVYGAQLVSEGSMPYRDFIDLIGPGSFYWLALFFKLFGTTFIVARGVLLLTGAVTAMLIYWMTRRLYRGPFDMLPALFFLLVAVPVWPAVSHHWDSDLFALIAVAAFFLWQDKRVLGYLIMAGVVAGVTSCFMQQKGLFLVLAFLIVILVNGHRAGEPRNQILSRVGTLLAGYAGVGALIILFFYLRGGLYDLVYWTLIFPAKSYHGANLTPYGFGLFEFNSPSWQLVFGHFFPPLVSKSFEVASLIPFLVIMALPFLLVILLVISYFVRTNRPMFLNELMLPYWGAGLALWASELHRKDIYHLIYGAPLLLILLFVTWNKATQGKWLLRNLGLAVVITGLLSFGTYNAFIAGAAKHKFTTRRGTVYTIKEDTALKFLHDHIERGEEVLIYPYYPMYYFLADIRNPTRFNVMLHWADTDRFFNEAVTALEQKRVKYILWDTVVDGENLKKWFPAYRQPPLEKQPLERYMRDHYKIIGMESGWRILHRQDSS